ncbi:TetR/AcrR family transcriptional regulator [Nocardia sp. AG03]|uniref:TetR/AcrR family transcriptional regulator n=1 Tax=Nocardia sp. AG03 TaxID=3025312 RepID=UPI002418AAA2|nr:TetR/AcrR family transcriptional regulator [Nocardia sp. AG03]
MTPDARRAQLLDVGEELFGAEPFDDVSMEQIAARAQVTRALLYHYFPTKADFFAAIWQRAHDTLRASAPLRTAETVRAGLVATLTAYLDFYARNLPLVLIANRSSIAGSPVVREPIDATFRTLCATVLDATGTTGHSRTLAEAAFAGWIAFVRETTLAGLVDRTITPADNLALCLAALDATVGAHADLRATPRPASG